MKSKASDDDLDVEVGVGGPERLHAQLEVLPVAALLRVLVAEGGGGVPGLPGRDRVVLDEGRARWTPCPRGAGP